MASQTDRLSDAEQGQSVLPHLKQTVKAFVQLRMRMRVIGALGLGILIAIAFAMVWMNDRLPSIKLAGGGELRVLKLSAGTNHFYSERRGWKGFLAQHLPASELARFGVIRRDVNDPRGSFALWVREVDADGQPVPVTLKSAGAMFVGGRFAPGTLRVWDTNGNVMMIELPIYPRADREFEVRLVNATETLSLKVRNPAPRARAKWTAAKLPQTNITLKTVFTLSGGISDRLRFRAQAARGPEQGWMHWLFEVEDTVGNRNVYRPGVGSSGFDWRLFEPGPLKIRVIADEYLSAGFVTEPAAGEIVKLNVHHRAAELGLKDVFLLGPGNFAVSGGPEVSHIERFDTARAGAESVRISAAKPNAALMYRPSAEVDWMNARVRERSKARNGGSVFSYSPWRVENVTMTNGNLLRYASIAWEHTTNHVETEIVVRHQPVEFYVEF